MSDLAAVPTALLQDEIFISYAREDRAIAQALADALARKGWNAWWDREIEGGDDFRLVIEEKIRACRLALVLWSENAKASRFVRDEADRAAETGKLLPLRIEEVEPPLGFGGIQTLDLIGWDGDDTAYKFVEVAEHIRRRLPGGSGPRHRRIDPTSAISRARAMLTDRRALLIGGGAAVAGGATWAGFKFLSGNKTREATRLTTLGLDELEAKAFSKARFLFNQALLADDRYAPALFYRAQVLIQSGAAAEAMRDLKNALSLRRGLDDGQLHDAERWLAELSPPSEEPAPLARATQTEAEGGSGGRSGGEAAVITRGIDGATPAQPRPPSQPSSQPPSQPSPRPSAAVRATVRLPNIPLSGPTRDALDTKVQRLFAPAQDARIAATTSLMLDAEALSDALPLAVAHANRIKRDGGAMTPAELAGVVNTLVLAQAASPATLKVNENELRRLLDAAKATGPQTSAQASATVAVLARADKPPTAFVQIAGDAQRSLADALIRRLREAGYQAPGVEVVGARAPAQTEIRVHGRSDKGLARWMAQIAENILGAPVKVVTLRTPKPDGDVFEIWFERGLCVAAGRSPAGCGDDGRSSSLPSAPSSRRD